MKMKTVRLFLRILAPHVGFASGSAITMIARAALERAGISGFAHRGAHLFRHSLASELLRSGATLSQIGQVLGHAHPDTTRIYAKVDLEGLRSLSLPFGQGIQAHIAACTQTLFRAPDYYRVLGSFQH